MSKAKTVKEVLVAARWMLENVGWCQGEYQKDREDKYGVPVAFCSTGAIYGVDKEGSPSQKDYIEDLAISHLMDEISGGSVITWNDKPERTKEEVLAAFDRAIKKA